MGLPSGTRWAPFNIGAMAPEDFGLYFSWGNIEGHAENSGYDFSQAVYDTTPAASISANLSLDQDMARANLGQPWRLPTASEFQELYDNCSCVWTTMNGVAGHLFTSNVNGNTLFFPAAGFYNSGTSLSERGSHGYYWSSTYNSATNAHVLSFDRADVEPQSRGGRHCGIPVRPVVSNG